MARLRTGRKVGRTLYVQLGEEPSDDDTLVGLMDGVELARLVVASMNYCDLVDKWVDRQRQAEERPS